MRKRSCRQQIEIAFCPDGEITPGGASRPPEAFLTAMGVTVASGEQRQLAYTNKGEVRWLGEAHGRNSSAYHGLSARMWKYVEDWALGMGEVLFTPDSADKVVVYPHKLVRSYPVQKTREEIFLCEEIDALVVVYTTQFRGEFQFIPRFDIRHIWKSGRYPYEVTWRHAHNLLLVTNTGRIKGDDEAPQCVGVSCSEPVSFSERPEYFPTTYPRDERRGVMGEAVPYQAGALKGRLRKGRVVFVFALGKQDNLWETARQALSRRQDYYVRRTARMDGVVGRASIEAGDADLERAMKWAGVSLDGLVMNQHGRGIYAGLPWFSNYWSRDTFISLPALLCLGDFDTCREILRSAIEEQAEDFQSPFYGRLPNLVSPGEVHYNTADGTWWFIRAAHMYAEYTGDVDFVRELLPDLIRAIEGEVGKRMDGEGFSIHGDAETWMDAAEGERVWTPRGNRAVEVQALWHGALLRGAEMAEWTGETGLAAEWQRTAGLLKSHFTEKFWDPENGCLYDHLDPDGTADTQARPNQIFSLVVPLEPVLPPEKERAVLDFVMDRLAYPHGVGSLATEDSDFRPRHIDLDRYPFDAAYHNGDVWVWLAGSVMTALIKWGRAETAWRLMRAHVAMLLREGAVGTLPELRDAVPPAEGSNEEGTFTQAWSLAETIRPFYQDFLGLRPKMVNRRIEIEPALPDEIQHIRFPAVFGGVKLQGEYTFAREEKKVHVELKEVPDPITLSLHLRVPGGKRLVAETKVSSPGVVEFVAQSNDDGWSLTINGALATFRMEETPFDIAKEVVPRFRVPQTSSQS